MIKKIFSGLLTSVFMFSGCSDSEFNPGGSGGGTKDDPSMFDFATSQTVKLLLNYDVPKGIVSTFDVYAENPLQSDTLRTDISPIASGINVSGVSEITRVLPSHVEKLYVYSPNLFVPLLSDATVRDGVASFSQMDVRMTSQERTNVRISVRNSSDFWKKEISKFLKKKEDFYSETTSSHSKYDLIQPDLVQEIPSEVFTAIGQTFPERQKADSKYLKEASIELKEAAEVFISILHCGAAFNNSFSYVVYEGPKKLNELTESEKMELEIINMLQLADVNTNTFKTLRQGLTPGHYVQLLYKNAEGEYVKEFPAGAKIGWILHSNAFDEANFAVKSSFRVFSPPNWNNPNDSHTGELNRTIFFAAKDKEGKLYNCFGFEDQKLYDDDCNDLIFHVQSNPVTAIETPEIINPGDEITKTESLHGILAFEDKWPKRDDYDLNDVVVKYNSTLTYVKEVSDTDGDATVAKVEDVFSFLHTGAAYNNAFSYKVNVHPDKLKYVKIEGQDYEVIPDPSGFIVDLCANVADVIPRFAQVENPKVYSLVMEFEKGAVPQKDFASVAAPYNPFITPREAPKPRTEIHLPLYPPTQRGDLTLFGTYDDCSDITAGLWYVSGVNNQYPFAIHLAGAESFKIPRESSSIDLSYPKYKSWVESGMTRDKDWYLYPANY